MKSIVYECLDECNAGTAINNAINASNRNLYPEAINIQAFTAFKVDGLWVVTITYK